MSSSPFISSLSVIHNGDMSSNVTSLVTIIQQLGLVDYQISWAGTSPVGSVQIQISNDYALNSDGSVHNAGTWSNLGSSSSVSGNSGSLAIDLASVAAYAIRIVYTKVSGVGLLQGILNAKGSGVGVTSLNLLSGPVTIAAGSNITVTPSGSQIVIASSGGGGGVTQTSATGSMGYMNDGVVDISFDYYLVRIGDIVTIHIPSFYPDAVPAAQSRYLQTTIPDGFRPKLDAGSDEFDIQFICDGSWGRMVAQLRPSTGDMLIFASRTTDNGSAADTQTWVAGETLAINGTAGSWIADPV